MTVSIVIPCRNEGAFIARCLESIAANDYPHQDLQVLVVDGMSTDGTRELVGEASRRWPMITMLDNPAGTTPHALNRGVSAAGGDVVMRMDAHATYDRHYISRCVSALERLEAGNVGGIWRIQPRRDTLLSWSIVQALSHRFGTGDAWYRLDPGPEPRAVDTVPYFCMRRDALASVGRFNEGLSRGQDMEFSLRVRAAGLKTYLIPDVISYYYARTDLEPFLRHNFMNGVWAVLPYLHTDSQPVSIRHLVPLAFVAWLLAGAMAVAVSPALGVAMMAAAGLPYVFVALLASADIAIRRRRPAYFLTMPFVFLGLHLSYGLGSAAGVGRIVWTLLRRGVRPATPLTGTK